MWLAPIVSLLSLAATPGPAPAATAPRTPAQWISEPVITRQTVFTIPYQIPPSGQTPESAAEVHLYLSSDRGAHWQLYGKIPPSQGHFLFRANADGEYWFVVRTVDRSGRMRPPWSNTPELRVVVDTTAPSLQLKAARGQAGQITAQWEVNELHLRANSFTLHYRAEPSQPWQAVAVGPQHSRAVGANQTGEVTWWPRVSTGTLQIRAEVSDAAGNTAVSHAQVELSPAAPVAAAQTPAAKPAQPPAATAAWHPTTPPASAAATAAPAREPPGPQTPAADGPSLVPPGQQAAETPRPVGANTPGTVAAQVTLSLSDNPRGPWTTLATGLPNTGRFDWLIQSGLPPQAFLRLEVRDAAGNVGLYETPNPVPLGPIPPSLRIRDARPIGQTGGPSG